MLVREDLRVGIGGEKRGSREGVSGPWITIHVKFHVFSKDTPPMSQDAEREVKDGMRPEQTPCDASEANFRG